MGTTSAIAELGFEAAMLVGFEDAALRRILGVASFLGVEIFLLRDATVERCGRPTRNLLGEVLAPGSAVGFSPAAFTCDTRELGERFRA